MEEYMTYGLFGENVSRSPFPQIYNALFDELKIPAVYIPFPVAKDGFLTALPVLRSDFAGFNVTTPFRLDIMVHLDRLDESAKKAGIVNTVKVENEKMIGYNTDMVGFERSLIGYVGNLYDKEVLLIGSGGAAYAVAHVLLEKGAFVTILSRNISHAFTLKDILQKKYNKNRVKVLKGLSPSDEFFAIVNTASVDLESPQSTILIPPHTYQNVEYAYDISYHQTAFMKKAEEHGVKTKGGFDMLFYQAIGALEVWAGKDAGLDVSLITKVHNHIKKNYASLMDGNI